MVVAYGHSARGRACRPGGRTRWRRSPTGVVAQGQKHSAMGRGGRHRCATLPLRNDDSRRKGARVKGYDFFDKRMILPLRI
ncbi:hypothetical protein BHM03_00000628 [Ensete ventricosum]|nr:hypothetical protein BHM03_00000628 [Ensete ventricosum]